MQVRVLGPTNRAMWAAPIEGEEGRGRHWLSLSICVVGAAAAAAAAAAALITLSAAAAATGIDCSRARERERERDRERDAERPGGGIKGFGEPLCIARFARSLVRPYRSCLRLCFGAAALIESNGMPRYSRRGGNIVQLIFVTYSRRPFPPSLSPPLEPKYKRSRNANRGRLCESLNPCNLEIPAAFLLLADEEARASERKKVAFPATHASSSADNVIDPSTSPTYKQLLTDK